MDDLASSVSKQWEVPIESKKYYNNIAYIGITRAKLTHKVSKVVLLGDKSVRNLSYSSKIALTLGKRLAFVEESASGLVKSLKVIDNNMKKVLGSAKNTPSNIMDTLKKIQTELAALKVLIEAKQDKVPKKTSKK